MQASRIRFVFDSDSLEVVLGNENKETENAFVGGENKWKFSSFTNWEFWWPNFPVLVYFKVQHITLIVSKRSSNCQWCLPANHVVMTSSVCYFAD